MFSPGNPYFEKYWDKRRTWQDYLTLPSILFQCFSKSAYNDHKRTSLSGMFEIFKFDREINVMIRLLFFLSRDMICDI